MVAAPHSYAGNEERFRAPENVLHLIVRFSAGEIPWLKRILTAEDLSLGRNPTPPQQPGTRKGTQICGVRYPISNRYTKTIKNRRNSKKTIITSHF
jgi:hypothetical protein